MGKLRSFATVVLGLLGISLIVIGYVTRDQETLGSPINSEILSVLGATLFGASFLGMVDIFLGNDIADIRKYLFRKEKLESARDHFETIAGTWHVYYLTKKNGLVVWRRSINEFSIDKSHNTVGGVTRVMASEADGTAERKYTIEAGLRGETLIVVNKAPDGSEADAVELVMGIAKTYATTFLGVQILETWDGDNAITYSVYSREKIVDGVDDEGDQLKLFETLKTLKKINRVADIGAEIAQNKLVRS